MSDPVLVPMDQLSEAALRGLVDAFILREGTDYGHVDTPFEEKRKQVRAQLERGEVVIAFDPATETVNLVLTRELS